jgi:hypothetical protein
MLSRKTPLKRSGFKPAVFGAVRATGKPRAKRMKSGKVAPTAAEKKWMAAIVEMGCCVCLKFHQVRTPAAVHHIVEGQRRLGHMFTIPLCDPGHHQNTSTPQKISRHPTKKRFEQAYGTEYELLAYTQEIVKGMTK